VKDDIRRYYFSEEDQKYIASLPEDEQARIDAYLSATLGGARIRLHAALANLGREIVRAFPRWLRRLLAKDGEA
jgi:pilus assembly protein TadC